jgi:chromosome segregation ATPase
VAVNIYQAVKQAMQDLIAPQLESLRGDITAMGVRVDALRAEMQTEFKTVRTEMQSEFKAVRTELRAEIETLRGEMGGLRGEIGGLRGEIGEVRGEIGEVRGDVRALRAELNGLRGETTANFSRLDERLTIALDVRERIVALEARLPR